MKQAIKAAMMTCKESKNAAINSNMHDSARHGTPHSYTATKPTQTHVNIHLPNLHTARVAPQPAVDRVLFVDLSSSGHYKTRSNYSTRE